MQTRDAISWVHPLKQITELQAFPIPFFKTEEVDNNTYLMLWELNKLMYVKPGHSIWDSH